MARRRRRRSSPAARVLDTVVQLVRLGTFVVLAWLLWLAIVGYR